MQWFLGNISYKSHVKFENTKKLKVTNKHFKRQVYGKSNVSLSQILKYVVNIRLVNYFRF